MPLFIFLIHLYYRVIYRKFGKNLKSHQFLKRVNHQIKITIGPFQ